MSDGNPLLAALRACSAADFARVTASLVRGLRAENAYEPHWSLLLTPPVLDCAASARAVGAALGLLELTFAVPQRLFGGDLDAFAADLGFDGAQRAVLLAAPQPWDPAVLGRWDVVESGGVARFIELNVGSTTGALSSVRAEAPFFAEPLFADALAAYGAGRHDLAAAWRAAVHGMLARRFAPPVRMAVVDDRKSFAAYQVGLNEMAAALSGDGVTVGACETQALRRAGDRICAAGAPLDAIYRVFGLEDAIADPAVYDPVVAALRSGALHAPMGLEYKLVANKQMLAYFFDDAFRRAASPAELDLIDAHVPRTLRLDRDAAALALRERERFVLKPADGGGGNGVACGWRTAPARWRALLDSALAGPGRFVVQARVPCPPQTAVVCSPAGTVAEMDCDVVMGLFFCGGRVHGGLSRAQDVRASGVVNIAQGAASGPLLLA